MPEAGDPEKEIRRGFDYAYRALAQKERTEAEMRELLAKREIGAAAIEAVIEELSQTGGLDDAEFARRFAEDKRRLAGWGSARIREALFQRGVERNHIEAALAEGSGAEEIERALELIAGRGYDLTLERDRARALGVLARKGYDSEVAYDAIRRLEAGEWHGR
jgi:regulatory protein